MDEKLKKEIQKRLSNTNWEKEISNKVISTYKQEKNKKIFFGLCWITLLLSLSGSLILQNPVDIVQESLEIHENLELSFLED